MGPSESLGIIWESLWVLGASGRCLGSLENARDSLNNHVVSCMLSNWTGLLGGLCVLSADILALRAYGKGIPISIAGPIMVGGSIVVVSIAGLVLGEKISLIKALAIIMIIAGSTTLAAISG